MSLHILGAGSPLVDQLVRVDDNFLRSHVSGEKGGMGMVEKDYIPRLLSLVSSPVETAPGGSTGNTVFALARMGVPVAMLGKLGNDANGGFYCRELKRLGGSDAEFLRTEDAPTGSCLSLITPDAERTMRSCLGAAQLLTQEEVLRVDYTRYDVVHIEGYMLFSPVFPVLLKAAKKAGCRISLDLASFEVVRLFRDKLPGMLQEFVDIVFANQDEAEELFPGSPPEQQLESLARYAEIAVVKLGRRGAIAARGAERVQVPADLVEHPADTTAAGDLWAAGFFYGLSEGFSLKHCAACGSIFSGEVVKVVGSVMPEDAWTRIRRKISELR